MRTLDSLPPAGIKKFCSRLIIVGFERRIGKDSEFFLQSFELFFFGNAGKDLLPYRSDNGNARIVDEFP